jgi:hypothetical protein
MLPTLSVTGGCRDGTVMELAWHRRSLIDEQYCSFHENLTNYDTARIGFRGIDGVAAGEPCAVHLRRETSAAKSYRTMPKSSQPIGPMRMQPNEHASIMAIRLQPMMPTQVKKAPQPKQKPTRTEAVQAAKATMTRRASLRKQREALRDKSRLGD